MRGRQCLAAGGLAALLTVAGCSSPLSGELTTSAALVGSTTTRGAFGGTTTTAAPGTSTSVGNTTSTTGADPTLAPTSTSTSPTTAAPTTLPALPPCPDGADPQCDANTAAGAAHLAASVRGGTFGFWVVRPGRGPVASLNPGRVFYPASSIKVLQHLHAVRWAFSQPEPADALKTPIPVYDDYCAGSGTSHLEPLDEVLEAMMVASDNQRASAVQDYFEREAINATAVQVVGTDDTLLAHRFGCGGPANNPANRMTGRDLGLVYEQVALGAVLTPAAAEVFAGLMLGPLWPSLNAAIAGAGRAAGTGAAEITRFRDGVDLMYKAGWWDTHLSVGGLLTLPVCPGEPPQQFAFAVFVDGAAAVADGFAVEDVIPIVLQEEIRSALAGYAGCPG